MKRKSHFSCFAPGRLIFFRFEDQTIKEFTYEGGETTFDVQAGLWIHSLDDAQIEAKVVNRRAALEN